MMFVYMSSSPPRFTSILLTQYYLRPPSFWNGSILNRPRSANQCIFLVTTSARITPPISCHRKAIGGYVWVCVAARVLFLRCTYQTASDERDTSCTVQQLRGRLGSAQIYFADARNVLRNDRRPESTAIVEVRHQEVSCAVISLYRAREYCGHGTFRNGIYSAVGSRIR